MNMITTLIIFATLLGAIIGSFLNVVVLRYGTGRSVGGRSGCMSCGYKLRWYDLIPVVSWISLRGKCRQCRSKISCQYPLVELGTAAMFGLIACKIIPTMFNIHVGTFMFVWYSIIAAILMVIFVYDMRHKIIPDGLSFTFMGMAFVQTLYMLPSHFWNSPSAWLDLLAGPIIAAPFFLIWYFSHGQLMGFGDIKLMLGIGWFLGLAGGVTAVVLSFWIGAIFSLALILVHRLKKGASRITMKQEIPFAPFLILGILIQFFWPMNLLLVGAFFI
jgi:prepilin signal peptidase PulO-like enzyme (type II secretory pathway)